MLMRTFHILKKNIFFLILVSFVLYVQIPMWLNNNAKEGVILTSRSYESIQINSPQQTYPPSGPALAIYWASWCAPCKIEMARLKESVLAGKIPRDRIFALNPHEDYALQRKFIEENQYPFQFITGKEAVDELELAATPTTILTNGTKVESLSSGLSLIGIWKAESFFHTRE